MYTTPHQGSGGTRQLCLAALLRDGYVKPEVSKSGPDREHALQRALGVTAAEIAVARAHGPPRATRRTSATPLFLAHASVESRRILPPLRSRTTTSRSSCSTEGVLSEEDSTKNSFDWTGQLQMLNESGGSDRRSFVEQLENVFATPAKIDLRGLLAVELPPPVLAIPVTFKVDTSALTSSSEQSSSGFQIPHSVSRLVDMKEPTMVVDTTSTCTLRRASWTSRSRLSSLARTRLGSDDSLLPPRPFTSGPSDGQINVKFKFGGDLPAEEKEKEQPKPKPSKKPLTLSDIIPPPSHIAGTLENSRASMISMHSRTRSRPQSGISFTGFDSFEEPPPAFYPPPVASNRPLPHAAQTLSSAVRRRMDTRAHPTNPAVPLGRHYQKRINRLVEDAHSRLAFKDKPISVDAPAQQDEQRKQCAPAGARRSRGRTQDGCPPAATGNPMQPKLASIKASTRNTPPRHPCPSSVPIVDISNPYTSASTSAKDGGLLTGAPARALHHAELPLQPQGQLRHESQLEARKQRTAESARKAELNGIWGYREGN
ncbi:hypothetical protein B0H14DRAFT_2578409 [Mycena olivaceomarginata]|nr:hypothetical protein B0H14DRAFT_2578409 [Mycena olivaceomarginata]